MFQLKRISPLLAVWTVIALGLFLSAAKFSGITAASGPPAVTDVVVGVQGGTTDVTWTAAQLSATPPNQQTGTTYTLALTDSGGFVEMNNAAANVVTIPPNSSVAFIVGSRTTIVQTGTGATTVAAGAGVTLLGSIVTTASQYAPLTIYQETANTWVLMQ